MKDRNDRRDMTSRERKEERRREEARSRGEDARTESEKAASDRRKRVFVAVALVAAIILVAAGTAIPVYMSCNYMFEDNPVAVIELKAGDRSFTMKYELFASDSPIACANFAYLASVDFFDGAVIYDTQNEWVRFGGYRLSSDDDGETTYTHVADDESFTSALTDDFSPERYEEDDHSGIFGYRLNYDDTSLSYTDVEFALCANMHDSAQAATEFQISGSVTRRDDYVTRDSTNTRRYFKVEAFGRPLKEDAQTAEAVEYILALQRSEETINGYFLAPTTPVVVTDVRVYNYSEEWTRSSHEHGFESYMTDELDAFYSDTWNDSHL